MPRVRDIIVLRLILYLSARGLVVFSTNAQRFRLDPQLTTRLAVQDVSAATIPKDFERNPRIHRCFEIRALQ